MAYKHKLLILFSCAMAKKKWLCLTGQNGGGIHQ